MPRLPRPKPGEPIKAEHYTALADAIERCILNVGPGSGLGMSQGPNGTDLWFSGIGGGGHLFISTSAIPKMTGTTPGSGTAKRPSFVAGVLGSGIGNDYIILNYHLDKGVPAAGAYLWAEFDLGAWWIVDPDSCAHWT